MSWIVRNLLLDRYIVLSNLHTVETKHLQNPARYGDIDYDEAYLMYLENDEPLNENMICTSMNVENDEFIFLREMEEKIKELVDSGQISELEYKVIVMLSEGNSYKEVSEKLKISRKTARNIFNSSCDKIAFSLGGFFTDEGYIEYMSEKYSLSDQQVEEIMRIFESNRRI